MAANANDLLVKVGGPGTATTLSAPGYTAGNTSINVGSTANWPTTTGVIFAMDEAETVNGEEVQVVGTYREFEGTVDTATSVTNVDCVYGTDRDFAAGATTRVYIPVSSERENRLVDGFLQDHSNPNGNHKTLTDDNGNEWLERGQTASAVNHVKLTNAATGNAPTIESTGGDTNVGLILKTKGTGSLDLRANWQGYITNVLPAVSSVTNNGNRSYDIVFASTVASYLTPGMRLRTTRTVSAPTQCTDLESGSSQYFSAASAGLNGMTFTDDFTCMAWIKLESYTGSVANIISRFNGTNGWRLYIAPSGQLGIIGGTTRDATTYQSVPLGRWVHVAASLNMSAGTAEMYIDGVLVPDTVAGAGTSLTQAGDLQIGAANSTAFFDGKIAQAAVFTTELSASTIRSYMSQGLSGSETNIVSAFSCNDSLLDLNTTNNNDLTANGGALMTNADSPFAQDSNGTPGGSYDYALVMKVSTTTATVQVPEGCTLPTSGGISAVDYATTGTPYGFPVDKGRWSVNCLLGSSVVATGSAASTTYSFGGTTTNAVNLNVPLGAWKIGVRGTITCQPNASTPDFMFGLSTSSTAWVADFSDLATRYATPQTNGSNTHFFLFSHESDVTLTAATPYYALVRSNNALTAAQQIRGSISTTVPGCSIITAIPSGI